MIEIKDLQKVIGESTTIDIPSLVVPSGEIVALVGLAGSGSEVLLALLTGQTPPTMGRVRISPLANLEFSCRLYNLPKARASQMLAQVGLADQAQAKLEKLPSGLSRRLAFGRALIHDPETLLLVEPFDRCDETTISLLSEVMRRRAEAGNALLVLASDSTHLESLCDAIYDLNQGRIVARSQPKEEDQGRIPFKIPIRLDDKVILFNPSDILYADAGEGRAYIVTAEGRLPTQFTLSELEGRLARSGFFRAHRSYLVNLQHVKEVIPYTRNSFTLRIDDPTNTEIPLSKSSASELKELLGY